MSATPATMIYRAAGQPPVLMPGRGTRPVAPHRDGVCMVCGAAGWVVEAAHVVSGNFCDWDRCRWRGIDRALCWPCAHAFKARELRTWPTIVEAGSVTCPAGPDDLSRVLDDGPLTAGCTVVVPLSRQVHVAPFAAWGRVCTDRRLLSWDAGDTARLDVYRTARSLGVSETAFHEPAPRWPQTKRYPHLVGMWDALAAWRADPAFLDVAARATRTPKET